MRRETGTFEGRQRAIFRLALTAAAVALAIAPSPGVAQAQRICGDRAELIKKLERKFREMPRAIGLAADGGLLEVLVSPAGGWTILISYPRQPTCVVAVGKEWQNRKPLVGEGV